MRICKKLSTFLCIILCVAMLSTTASAYTVFNVGADSVVTDGLDVALQGYIYYNSYTRTALDLYAMQTHIWNNSDNIDIDDSFFLAQNATRCERSDDYWPQFYLLGGGPIPAGSTRIEINTINWSELVSLYNQDDTVYSYTSEEFCLTNVGFRVETFMGGISFYYFFDTAWLPTLNRITDTVGF